MAQTKSALASGGIHPSWRCQGFSSFFLEPDARSRAISHLCSPSSPTDRPTTVMSSAAAPRAARYTPRPPAALAFTIELQRFVALLGGALERRFQPLFDSALAHPLHRARTDPQRLANWLVLPPWPLFAHIRCQQNLRMQALVCRRFTLLDQCLKLLAFLAAVVFQICCLSSCFSNRSN